jgi:hypothetical protein
MPRPRCWVSAPLNPATCRWRSRAVPRVDVEQPLEWQQGRRHPQRLGPAGPHRLRDQHFRRQQRRVDGLGADRAQHRRGDDAGGDVDRDREIGADRNAVGGQDHHVDRRGVDPNLLLAGARGVRRGERPGRPVRSLPPCDRRAEGVPADRPAVDQLVEGAATMLTPSRTAKSAAAIDALPATTCSPSASARSRTLEPARPTASAMAKTSGCNDRSRPVRTRGFCGRTERLQGAAFSAVEVSTGRPRSLAWGQPASGQLVDSSCQAVKWELVPSAVS